MGVRHVRQIGIQGARFNVAEQTLHWVEFFFISRLTSLSIVQRDSIQ
jgi:hypothetical protein